MSFRSNSIPSAQLAERPKCPRSRPRNNVVSALNVWPQPRIQCPSIMQLGNRSYENYSAVIERTFFAALLPTKE